MRARRAIRQTQVLGRPVIATLRTKTKHIQTKDEKDRTVIQKVGMEPIQRDGVEYEFDVVCDIDPERYLAVSKTRCDGLDGEVIYKAGEELGETLRTWLTAGADVPPQLRRPNREVQQQVRAAAEAVGKAAAEALEANWAKLMRTQADAEARLERLRAKVVEPKPETPATNAPESTPPAASTGPGEVPAEAGEHPQAQVATPPKDNQAQPAQASETTPGPVQAQPEPLAGETRHIGDPVARVRGR